MADEGSPPVPPAGPASSEDAGAARRPSPPAEAPVAEAPVAAPVAVSERTGSDEGVRGIEGTAALSMSTPPPPRDRFRITALLSMAASLLLVTTWFLPWIDVPESVREPIAKQVAPDLEALRERHPDLARQYDLLLAEATEEGRLTGLDLFLFLRTGWSLNQRLAGPEPEVGAQDATFALRRAFLVGAVLLLALPLASVLLAVYFVTHRFRRVRSPVLILLMLAGGFVVALSLTWMRFVTTGVVPDVTTGIGLRLALGAGIAQACAGLVGVSARDWWRVYLGFLVTLGALGLLVFFYVRNGLSP